MTTLAARPEIDTLADLLLRLGSIPPERIAAYPPPGAATEADLLSPRPEQKLYELVDGVLVEKAMGYYEATSWRITCRLTTSESSSEQTVC